MSKLPISAMVVGFNEAHFLKNCFKSLYFCDEIIYTDLNSTDDSIKIASEFTNIIYTRSKVPSGEYIQSEIVNYTKHEWVIFIDPDELIDPTLAQNIVAIFDELKQSTQIGALLVPWHFYFKKKKLEGTIWGGTNEKHLLVNKNRFDFLPITHYGRKLKPNFINYEVKLNSIGTNILHHYWMNSYTVFLKKHQRYLKNEGIDEYNRGRRVTFKQLLLRPWLSFKECFFSFKGYKDGFVGLLLSIFWAYYKTNVALNIRKVQKQNKFN